jgi:hypothetical protein
VVVRAGAGLEGTAATEAALWAGGWCLGFAFGFGLGFGFAGVVAVVVAGAAAAALVVREGVVDEAAPQPATTSARTRESRIAGRRRRVMVLFLWRLSQVA